MFKTWIIILIMIVVGVGTALPNTTFPLREKYSGVKTIEAEELYHNMDKFIIIDVRSRYEYNIIRILTARHAALSKDNFIDKVKIIRKSQPEKTIVFYCNGITCAKSYKACKKAQENGIENIVAMDWGVLNWAKTYPDQAKLLGETPVDSKKIISKDKFKAHLLPPSEFAKRINDHSVVIDVRDEFQREVKIYQDSTHHVPLEKVYNFAKVQSQKGKTLLIYDAVGKQVRWLQYYLEKIGVANYYFLDKGVKGYLSTTQS